MKTVSTYFFAPIMLLITSNLNAAQPPIHDVAQQYPFSNVDKTLFYNPDTQKMHSPFSTASVSSFSGDKYVMIDKNSFDKLRTNALGRASIIKTAAGLNYIDEKERHGET